VECLVFHPDAANEAAGGFLRLGLDVKNNASYRTQEFAVRIFEIVVLGAEAVLVDVRHLREAARREARLLGALEEIEDVGAECLIRVEALVVHAAAEFHVADEIRVAADRFGSVADGTQELHIRFDQRLVFG